MFSVAKLVGSGGHVSVVAFFSKCYMSIFLGEFGNEFFDGSSNHSSQRPTTKYGTYVRYPCLKPLVFPWFHPYSPSFDLDYL